MINGHQVSDSLHCHRQDEHKTVPTEAVAPPLPAASFTATRTSFKYNREQYIKLILQTLQDEGLAQSAAVLSKESGILFETEAVRQFRGSVLEGDFGQARTLLPSLFTHSCPAREDANYIRCIYLIERQRYLELLQTKKFKEAVECLRNEITPNAVEHGPIQQLAALLTLPNAGQVERKIGWRGGAASRLELLTAIQGLISPGVMLPERRMDELLKQASYYQASQCPFHVSLPFDVTFDGLLENHKCNGDAYSFRPICKLLLHNDEVWHVSFRQSSSAVGEDNKLGNSFDGDKSMLLAASSKDGSVSIWSAFEGKLIRRLMGHNAPVTMSLWSPSGLHLLSCSLDCRVRIWEVATGECLRIFLLNGEVSSAVWCDHGSSIIVASDDGVLTKFTSEGVTSVKRSLHCRDLQLISNNEIAALDSTNAIHILKVDTLSTIQVVGINVTCHSLAYSSQTHLLLVGTNDEDDGILMYQIKPQKPDSGAQGGSISSSDSKNATTTVGRSILENNPIDFSLVTKFKGHWNSRYLIRSCFAFPEDGVVVTGGEDGKIHLYNRCNGRPLTVLDDGHEECVNSVDWSPEHGGMLASCSDDRKIIIWMRS